MDYKLGGTIRGDRTIEPCGNFLFEDLTNNLRAVVIMGTYKTSGFWTVTESGGKDQIEGVIYKTSEPIDEKVNLKRYFKTSPIEVKALSELKDKGEELGKISGSVIESILINDEEIWNLEGMDPVRHYPTTEGFICPSDWRFREDLIWLKRVCLDYAGAWKLKKENQQREDRAFRKEAEKKRNKG